MPLVTGVTHDPDTDAPLTGLWAVRRFTSFSDPAEFIADPEENWSLYVAPGRNAPLSLDATTGTELYWAQFTSSDGELVLGPYLFTLTADRTWDDVIANPAPTPATGGGIVLDGTTYVLEVNDGATVGPNANFSGIPFDTLDGEPYEDGTSVFAPGLYLARLELDFDQPAEDRTVVLRISGGDSAGMIRQGPFILSSTATAFGGYTGYASGQVIITEDGSVSLSINTTAGDAVAPADLAVSYAELLLKPITPVA